MSGYYAADGSMNVTVVSGTTGTGLYARDGSINVVNSPGTGAGLVGTYHPCGALWVTLVTTNNRGRYAFDGSLNVCVSPYTNTGAQRVTVVSGSAPDAPVLTLISGTGDNTPDFTLTGDLVVGDTVRFQYSTSAVFSGASEITNTIDAGEDAANSLSFSTGPLADGTWYFRARIERPSHVVSDWSNTQTETIDTTASVTLNNQGTLTYHANGASLDISFTVNAGTNRALLVTLARADGSHDVEAGVAMTWDQGGTNQAMSLIKSQSRFTGVLVAQIWGLRAPTVGTHTLHITWSNTASDNFVCPVSYDHVVQSSDGAAFPHTASDATNQSTVDVTSAVGNQVVGCMVNTDGGQTPLGTALFNDVVDGSLVNAAAGYVDGAVTATVGMTGGVTSAIVGVDVQAG